jgi:hypothetical protein
MSMPGFTADASLTNTRQHYALASEAVAVQTGTVLPQLSAFCVMDNVSLRPGEQLSYNCWLVGPDGSLVPIPKVTTEF